MQGQVIPYVAGRQRVNMNLIWYGNFTSSANHDGGGKGGSPASSYSYSCAYIAALALGQIKGIYNVWYDKSTTSLEAQNLAYALGSSGQATWSGYPSGTPTGQEIPYDHIAYVASSSYALGSSAAMPDLTFEIEGVVGGYDDANGVYDADPSAVVVDYLTDPVHGAAFSGTIETLTGTTNTYQAYCMSLGLVTSPYENNQRAATDFMQELMQITNSDCFLSCGVLKVTPYADTAVSGTTPDGVNWSYTPDLTPIFAFADDDYCPKKRSDPVELTRKALSDTYNIVNLIFNDRSNFYDQAPASTSDNYDISIRGPRAMSTLTFQQITQASVAKTVAQLILQFQLYERNSYKFRVRGDYSLLEPMDYISITDSGLGLTNQVCRITQIDDDDNNFVTITAMEVPGTIRNTPQYNWDSAQGYYANFSNAPGNVAAPLIFQMPAMQQGTLSDGITLAIAVGPPTANTASWGGCQIYMSSDGGNTYGWVGIVGPYGIPRYGTITDNIAAVASPDTTSTLSVALQNTTQQLSTAVTEGDATDVNTLFLVGTGTTAELMAYGAASLVSAGNYNLSYLVRNLYSSTNQAHSAGDPFVRLDGTLFQIQIPPGLGGKELWFKFCSYNQVGQALQDIADVTAYAYTPPVSNQTPQSVTLTARGSCVVNGENVYKAAGSGSAWNSDAVSATPFTAGNISAQYGAGTMGVGYVTSTGSTANPTTNMYAIYAISGSQVEVVENGTVRYTGAAPAPGDLYDVQYDGFVLDYRVNGVSVWGTLLQGASLYGAVSLYDGGDVMSNVQVASGPVTATYLKAFGNGQLNGSTITKQGGSAGWDSGVYSVSGYTTCHITAKQNATAQHTMIGLAKLPVAASKNGTNTGADYSWQNVDGAWYVYEGSTNLGEISTTVALTDMPAITYDGTTVRWYLNNVLAISVSASGLTLYGIVMLDEVGSGINSLVFGPTTNLAVIDTQQVGNNAATDALIATDSNTYDLTLTNRATPTSFCELSVGPYPQAMDCVVTVNTTLINTSATEAAEVFIEGCNGGFGAIATTLYLAPGAQVPITWESMSTIPAGSAYTNVNFLVEYLGSSSLTVQVVGPSMQKWEVIKK